MDNAINQTPTSTETVRKLVVPTQSQGELPESDRSPTKTERDVNLEVNPVSHPEAEVIRKLVVPGMTAEVKDGDRSPTKTERHLDGAAIEQAQQKLQ